MKRYLSIFTVIITGLCLFACNPNKEGKAVCTCTLNGKTVGLYELGSLKITEAISQCNVIQYQNPADTCNASLDN